MTYSLTVTGRKKRAAGQPFGADRVEENGCRSKSMVISEGAEVLEIASLDRC